MSINVRFNAPMPKKSKLGLILLIIAVIIFGLLIIFFVRSFSKEGSWICENGIWVKHGNPNTPEPIEICQ